MFNKISKIIRWTILFGMLYTLYSIIITDKIEFNDQKDESVLLKMAKDTNKSKELFKIRKQLNTLFPDNVEYKKEFDEIVKIQANKLLDAHEKMLLPTPIGNYKYIDKIEFGKDKNNKYVLIMNLTKTFDKKLEKSAQTELKKIFYITHHGIYEHYGFDKNMTLILSPTFNDKSEIKIIDLDRKYEEKLVEIPSRPENK